MSAAAKWHSMCENRNGSEKTKQNKKRSVPHTLCTFLAILRLSFIQEMKVLMEPTENSEKSEPQMGFEPTTLRDLFGCSNHLVVVPSAILVIVPSAISFPISF